MKDPEERFLIIIIGIGLVLFVGFIVLLGPSLLFHFLSNRTEPKPVLPVPTSGIVPTNISKECKVAGCSGQLCVDSNDDISTTCEFNESFSCYKENYAKCEVQSDGKCGWTQNTELKACLEKSDNQDPLKSPQ